MAGPPPGNSGDGSERLKRCIRDLSALSALPSLCVGRTPSEALDIVLDALPTALDCDLIYLMLPGEPAHDRGSFRRVALSNDELQEIRAVTATDADGSDAQLFLSGGKLFCIEAEIPIGGERGRLLAGRTTPLDAETDRVQVRAAANIVGTILETANVLDAARRKDDFLAMLGHELRNPLAAIVTAVELQKHRGTPSRETEVVDRHAQHLARLVDDLLDISRLARGHVELRNEAVPLASILERAVEIAAPLVTRNRHALEVENAGDLTLQGDPVRLTQVFANLLTNAAKFTPPGGRIEVLVQGGADRARVSVRDNGAGIAADQLERIFEPFVQADRARDVLRGGLGLGLAIVSNMVRRHGGSVSVQSAGRGQGATFTVELPTARGAEAPKVMRRSESSAARSHIRVLVVDDNTDLAELLAEALQSEGFQTAIAYDGSGAIDRWRTFLPHVGVLDVGLPDFDGYELARTVRAEHGRGATLIAVTGYGQPTDRQRAADAGFDVHLVKPVNVDELVDVLDERLVAEDE
ncbi:MAG TPA: hybrid sensor histidine kinase/response regulator [Polyangia bacterium]|nr:hybrid sensor histidine kinase/response regulator [Polyangia bacterium]